MSIICMGSLFGSEYESTLAFESLNFLIYLNMSSCICFMVYCMLYKSDLNLRQPPNNLLIQKMFGECMVSLHLLVLFLCFSFENHKRKMNQTKTIMYIISIFSPGVMFMTYFFNLCIAHNLYITFYRTGNDMRQRMRNYQIFTFVGFILITFISYICNLGTQENSDFKFFSFYSNIYSKIIYVFGMIMIIYIILILKFLITQYKNKLEMFLQNDLQNDSKKELVNVFVKRHITLLIFFLLCYMPNNFIHTLHLFYDGNEVEESFIYKLFIFLLSSSCVISFMLKITEPYMKKYLKLVIFFILRKREIVIEEKQDNDYAVIYLSTKEDKLLNPEGLEMRNLENVSDYEKALNILYQGLRNIDYYAILVGICATLDKEYMETNITDSHYSEINRLRSIDQTNVPKYISHFTKIRDYCPKIFNHIRRLENITNEILLNSLAPDLNLECFKKNKAQGGRSSSPIIFTHDKKFLIKMITYEERNVLLSLIKEYHFNIRNNSTLLSVIFGCYLIRVNDNREEVFIIMKNVCELPQTSKILAFDLKGSTVDRRILQRGAVDKLKSNNLVDPIIKNLILKDEDFLNLGLYFRLSKNDKNRFESLIYNDTEMLKNKKLTDYSFLVYIHEYRKEDYEKFIFNNRVMKSYDDKFIYCFSIIDFLTPFDISKMGEIFYKNVKGYISRQKDFNISAMDDRKYAHRFFKFIMHRVEIDPVCERKIENR